MNNIQIKRIGIDARFYGPIGKGLGRYTQEIVDNVIRLDHDNDYVIFLRKENYFDFKITNPRVKKVLTDVRWYSLAEQLLMPIYFWREKLDLIHFPHFNVPIFCLTKFVVTIHDLILISYPTKRATTLSPIVYKIKNLGYYLVIWSALKRAKKIITVSEFTKKGIIEKFKVKSEKIIVTYEGVSETLQKKEIQSMDDKEVLLGYNIHKPYLLYVGNAYPHKNLESLLKIFTKVSQKFKNLQLVLVGKEDYFYLRLKTLVNNLKLNDHSEVVIFAGYVSDNKLNVFYQNALAYIFSSFFEGFGLPPLEAMGHGLPVVSSNKASMPEVLGNAVLYFDPSDLNDMYQKIEMIVTNETLRNDLRELGYRQVKKYSWKVCVSKTLEIYRENINLNYR